MRRAVSALAVALVAACSGGNDPVIEADAAAVPTSASVTTTSSTTTTSTTSTTSTTTSTTTTLPPPPVRVVADQAWVPFATVGGITLVLPSSRVEHIGFHESNHDGAQSMELLAGGAPAYVLETRERGTGAQTAADIVVDPAVEIRAPVTGTVLRAGTYTLYCDYSDDYVVIEPDDHPGWEVKVLHISGEQVSSGDRVVAGETVLAPNAHILPFESQVDEIRTADPAWPHTHVEVVDPSIPDRPTPGGGCS